MKNIINRALAAEKKLFTLLLAVAASVGTMFASTKIGNLYYNLDATNQTAEVTSQNSSYPYWSTTITTAIIPSSVTYNSVSYSVTSIGGHAFSGCRGLTSVAIPNSVTSIGVGAFSECTGLTSVTIPNSVTSIGVQAFYYCSGLTSVTIPYSVTSIGYEAFYNCRGLTSVTIPGSVTSIGRETFYGCSGLTSINVASDNSNYCSVDGVLFNKDKTTLIQYPGSKQGAYTIPNSVTSIVDDAFYGCSGLTSVTIPNSVTSIGMGAFSECSGLTSVTIGNSVTSIGDFAFSECSGLTSIEIPNSVTSIGDFAFYNCSSLTSVTIPNSVTSIGESAFRDCSSLTSVTIPNSVTSIGDRAFYNCSGLTSINVKTSNLNYCSVEGVLFNKDKTELIQYPIGNSRTEYVTPNSVTSIGGSAFEGCSGLTSVTIGNSVTSIGESAFRDCSSLTSVTIEAETPPSLGSLAFSITNDCPIYVPGSSIDVYKNRWSDYASRIYGIYGHYTWLQTGGSGLGSMTTNNSNVWTYNSQYGAVGKKQGGATGWLLTPTIDLRGMKSVTLSFSHTHKFATNYTNEMTLWVCDNYKGDVGSSTWKQLSISPYASNNDWTFVNVDIDVPLDYVGKNTVFGFKYVSTASNYATWEIKNLQLVAECAGTTPPDTLGHADVTTVSEVTATPNEDNSVTLTWPAVNGAETYTIEIKKNGDLICTLVFNANGQLISMNFAAPARNGKGRNIPAAEHSANGWTYVVTGLKGNASYTYSVTAKDVNGNVLLKQSVDFSMGEEPTSVEEVPSDKVPSDKVPSTKVLRNGCLYILRGDKTYTTDGRLVR